MEMHLENLNVFYRFCEPEKLTGQLKSRTNIFCNVLWFDVFNCKASNSMITKFRTTDKA